MIISLDKLIHVPVLHSILLPYRNRLFGWLERAREAVLHRILLPNRRRLFGGRELCIFCSVFNI